MEKRISYKSTEGISVTCVNKFTGEKSNVSLGAILFADNIFDKKLGEFEYEFDELVIFEEV